MEHDPRKIDENLEKCRCYSDVTFLSNYHHVSHYRLSTTIKYNTKISALFICISSYMLIPKIAFHSLNKQRRNNRNFYKDNSLYRY